MSDQLEYGKVVDDETALKTLRTVFEEREELISEITKLRQQRDELVKLASKAIAGAEAMGWSWADEARETLSRIEGAGS